MAEKNNSPRGKKPVRFTFNISWIYIILLFGIGYMFFNQGGAANPQKEEWAEVKQQWLDGDIKEIVDYIDERYSSYERYNLETGKRMALLALEMCEQLFAHRKMLHEIKVERDELNNAMKEMSALLEEGQEVSSY